MPRFMNFLTILIILALIAVYFISKTKIVKTAPSIQTVESVRE